jgi:small conductance mechanosensitive channel
MFTVGIWLSGLGEYFAVRLLSRVQHFCQMLRDFFVNIVRYSVLTVTALTVLSQFGVQTTSLVAVIGAASLAIGRALQGMLFNLAAGGLAPYLPALSAWASDSGRWQRRYREGAYAVLD